LWMIKGLKDTEGTPSEGRKMCNWPKQKGKMTMNFGLICLAPKRTSFNCLLEFAPNSKSQLKCWLGHVKSVWSWKLWFMNTIGHSHFLCDCQAFVYISSQPFSFSPGLTRAWHAQRW
jgi:hypothetical protein